MANSYHQRRAEAYCNAMGLTNTEEKIDYCRYVAKQLNRVRTLKEYRAWMEEPRSEIAKKWADDYRNRKK